MIDRPCRFTVVIPALNEEAFIGRLLESLADQSLRDFEVVVVDSKSDDRTGDVAQRYRTQLPSLKVVRARERGLAFARNLGAETAGAKDIVFMDADGEVPPTFLEELARGIQEKKLTVATTLVKPASRNLFDRFFYTCFIGWGLRIFQHFFPIVTGSCIVVRREIFEKVGGFDPTIEFEDSAFARNAARLGRFGVLEHPVVTTSVRRLEHYGRWRTLFKLLFFGVFRRLTRGEMRQKEGFYRFGEYEGGGRKSDFSSKGEPPESSNDRPEEP